MGAHQERNPEVTETTIDRLSHTIGIEKVASVFQEFLPHFLQNEQWTFRHAALMGLTQVPIYFWIL
jgi:rRNA maturation protein Rpf1